VFDMSSASRSSAASVGAVLEIAQRAWWPGSGVSKVNDTEHEKE
jgi:hypothetical protein